MIPEYDLEASGTNACISSLCFLCMLSHSPSCRFLSMPRLVWNKPIYLGRRGSRCEGLWKSHPGLPSELSCSPGSSSSMFITTVPNSDKFMGYTKILEAHIHQARHWARSHRLFYNNKKWVFWFPIQISTLRLHQVNSVQFSSVTQSCPTLCDPMDCTTPGLPVHHQLPEFTQTHVRWVGDAIQPSHPLSSLYPPAFNISEHQGLFKWVSSSHQVAKVLEFQLQHQSFQWMTDFL